jgi:hypothetical protein
MDIWKCSIVFGIYIYIFILDIIHIILNIFDKLLCISKEIWEECVKNVYKVIDGHFKLCNNNQRQICSC